MLLTLPSLTMNETLYLYRNQNEPKVKLTCVKQSLSLIQLIDYFHNLQDLYNVQFTITETITENLMVECANIRDTPWYIIEFDEILDKFCIWKNDNNWNLNKIINKLYNANYSLPDMNKIQNEKCNEKIDWENVIGLDETYLNHPLKDTMKDILIELNFNWRKLDMSEFWKQFNKNWNVKNSVQSIDNKNKIILKSVLKITLLTLITQQNKLMLQNNFNNYYNKMKLNNNSNIIDTVEKKSNKVSTTSEDDELMSTESESIMSSNKISPSLSPIDMRLSDSSSSESYIYDKNKKKIIISNNTSNIPKMSKSKQNNKKVTNNQLYVNFKQHFKEIVEDYEIFELRTKGGIPIKTRSKLKSNSISK